MKLRFEVDQAAAFRQGIDVPKSIVTIEVNPAELSQEQRDLIADRLDGIDVCQLADILGGTAKDPNGKLPRIMAKLPTFESLMEAIDRDERDAESSIKKRADESNAARLAREKSEVLLKRFLGTPKPDAA
jgi:hypothetical protein